MVVVIIAILGGIALPRFYPQKEKAYVAEAIGILSAIRQSEEAYKLEDATNSYKSASTTAADWLALGLENPTSSNWTYAVTATAGTSFDATATRISTESAYDDKTIQIDENGVYCGTHPNGPKPGNCT